MDASQIVLAHTFNFTHSLHQLYSHACDIAIHSPAGHRQRVLWQCDGGWHSPALREGLEHRGATCQLQLAGRHSLCNFTSLSYASSRRFRYIVLAFYTKAALCQPGSPSTADMAAWCLPVALLQCSVVQPCAPHPLVKTCTAAAGLCGASPTAYFVLWSPAQAAADLRPLCSRAGLFEVSFTPQHAAAYEAVAGCLAEGGATSRVQVGLLGHEACMHALHNWPAVHCQGFRHCGKA